MCPHVFQTTSRRKKSRNALQMIPITVFSLKDKIMANFTQRKLNNFYNQNMLTFWIIKMYLFV